MSKGIHVDIPVQDLVPGCTFNTITEYAFDEAKEKIKGIDAEFNENCYTFEYELICRVIIKRKNDTSDTDMSGR